jgi:alanyl aminopeptidase
MSRREARDQVWTFYKQHYAELAARMRDDETAFLISIPGAFCDAAHRDEARNLLTGPVAHIDGGPMSLAMTLEGIDQCIATRERNARGIETFLKAY